MFESTVDVHVHYKHTEEEVARLASAIVPLRDAIIAVGSPADRGCMKRILTCQYFRRKEAARVRLMLIRAVKYAKAHLADYFPMLHPTILEQAQELDDALAAYWVQFSTDATETQPTH